MQSDAPMMQIIPIPSNASIFLSIALTVHVNRTPSSECFHSIFFESSAVLRHEVRLIK